MVVAIPYSTAMGLSRADWTEAALDALAREGFAAVAIDPLARRLGATKGSFYWHFEGRDDLIAAVLERWEQRDTVEVVATVDAIDDPRERLVSLARVAFGQAARGADAQAAVLAAAADPRVAPVLTRVTATRLAVLERLYRDAGVAAQAAARHARLTYAMYVGMGDLRRAAPSARPSDDDVEADIELMVDMLVRAALNDA
jgi:AcrR family transcriptional regulator